MVAIGIPTVIDAATIVNDTVSSLLDVLEQQNFYKEVFDSVRSFDDQEKYMLFRELMAPEMAGMFVTPKDIDQTMEKISYTISEAINSICHHIDPVANSIIFRDTPWFKGPWHILSISEYNVLCRRAKCRR